MTAGRRAPYSVRVLFTTLRFPLPSWHTGFSALTCIWRSRTWCNALLAVYDVSNRESFEALPRWLKELENDVPSEVVKIVVGIKLDKVSVTILSPFPFIATIFPTGRRPPTHDAQSGQVSISEDAAFAARTGCLFVEASAKTAVGVTEVFNVVVARLIDMPSLWDEEKLKSSGRTTAAVASGPRRDTAESMLGNIDLSQVQDEDTWQGVCVSSAEVVLSLPGLGET